MYEVAEELDKTMKIKKTYVLFIITFLTASIFITRDINADSNRLETQEINVFIKSDGSARIKEKRVANLVEGTENYIAIGELGKSEIINFKVTEDGKLYELQDSWNTDDSKENKTFKNGLTSIDDRYELVWGIGEYGRHEYILEYEITNFIKELEDSQVLLWKFVNYKTNTPPQSVVVTIESEKPFSAGNQEVKGIGFKGDTEFKDNKVVAKSLQPFSSKNHLTILLKLEKGTFSTEDHVDQTFEEVKEMAFKGNSYGSSKSNTGGIDKKSIIIAISGVVGVCLIIAIALFIKQKRK